MSAENLTHLLDTAIEARMLALRTVIPARVESYEPSTQQATVLPLLYQRASTGELLTPLPIGNIPVIHPRGGGFAIHLPLAAGDLGMLLCADRSLDAWLSGSGGLSDPASTRHHQMMDAVFLPGLYPPARPIAAASLTDLTIGNETGEAPQISLSPDGTITLLGGQLRLGSSAAAIPVASSAKTDANFAALSSLLATITEPAFITALATALASGWPQSTGTSKILGES